MRSKKEAEEYINESIIKFAKAGSTVWGFQDTGDSLAFNYKDGFGVNAFVVQYKSLHENDICEVWNDGDGKEDRSLYYFDGYVDDGLRFKECRRNVTTMTFDYYRIIERAEK